MLYVYITYICKFIYMHTNMYKRIQLTHLTFSSEVRNFEKSQSFSYTVKPSLNYYNEYVF